MKKSVLTLLSLCLWFHISAQLELSKLFTDHMVIQRDRPINVWGTAIPGSNVHIVVNKNSQMAKADLDGNWLITLPASPAGGPYQMEVSSGNERLSISDLVIGDVWLCSGQSNMEWTVANSDRPDEAKSNASDALIRHFKVPHTTSTKPDNHIEGGPWEVTGPETVEDFTAVGYYFAQTLRSHQDVPIGLLNSSWGGSRIEPWMSAEALNMNDPITYLENFEQEQAKAAAKQLKELQKKFPGLDEQDAGMKDDIPLWAAIKWEDHDWQRIEVPGLWEGQGYQGVDGIGWYRNYFELSKDEAKAEISINVSRIDDSDKVWINGHFVGGMEQAYNKLRSYAVNPDFLKEGKNTIAIRVEDTGGGGGIHGSADNAFINTSTRKISLAGKWRFKLGALKAYQTGTSANHVPMLLYNKMIHPLLKFPIKGVIWYQGESNAGSEEDATRYADLFQTMIKQWRDDWNIDFPFLFVQLANFMAPDAQPQQSNWALLRESQSAATALPKVGEAIIIDIGEADDIHPRNKQDVGWRLAQAARKLAYGEDVVYHGPVYQGHSADDRHLRIQFDQKLKVKNKYGYVNGFAIAGSDGKFKWAKAIVKGDQVTVWHEAVRNPKHVRYAWGNNPDDVNLYNEQGMPVRPFRTEK